MDGLIGFVVIIFVIIFIAGAASGGGATGKFDSLVKSGTPARGILLRVAATGTGTGLRTRRFELRDVTIDIEVPGQAPYEVSTTAIIPINLVRDVLPGATVEVRVDGRQTNRIAIVGPGTGFVQGAVRTA